MFPRRKAGEECRAGPDHVVVTKETLSQYFDRPLRQAAIDLGISPSALKSMCRKLEIDRWPFQEASWMSSRAKKLNKHMEVWGSSNTPTTTICHANPPSQASDSMPAAHDNAGQLLPSSRHREMKHHDLQMLRCFDGIDTPDLQDSLPSYARMFDCGNALNESEILCLKLVTGKYLHLQVTDRYTPEGFHENNFEFVVWTDCYTMHDRVRSLSITPKAVNYGHGDSLRLHELVDDSAQADEIARWLDTGFALQLFGEYHAGFFL